MAVPAANPRHSYALPAARPGIAEAFLYCNRRQIPLPARQRLRAGPAARRRSRANARRPAGGRHRRRG